MSPKTPPTKRRYGLVVLSMHRSGSSAFTGLLGKMGCDLPQTLMPANRNNPKGYFESLEIYRLNNAILASGGSSWDDWQEFNPDWMASPPAAALLTRGQEVLEKEYGTSSLFVIKDPRICRLLPIWKKFLKTAEIEPVYIHAHRNPVEVAQSLQKREGWPFGYGLLLWLRHVLEAEFQTRGSTRLFTSYHQVLTNWRQVLRTIETRAGIVFPRQAERMGPEIENFLNTELRHNAEPDDGLASNPLISQWVSRSFGILENWVRSGEVSKDYETLDAIRAEFDMTVPMFGALIDVMRVSAKEADERAGEQSRVIAGFEADLSTLKAAKEAETDARKAAEAARDTALEECDALRQQIRNITDEKWQIQSELSQRRSEAEEMGQLNQEAQARVARLTSDVTRLRKERDRLTGIEARLADANELARKTAQDREALIKDQARQRAHIVALGEEKAMILNSTSWKLTAPLRGLVTLLKR